MTVSAPLTSGASSRTSTRLPKSAVTRRRASEDGDPAPAPQAPRQAAASTANAQGRALHRRAIHSAHVEHDAAEAARQQAAVAGAVDREHVEHVAPRPEAARQQGGGVLRRAEAEGPPRRGGAALRAHEALLRAVVRAAAAV